MPTRGRGRTVARRRRAAGARRRRVGARRLDPARAEACAATYGAHETDPRGRRRMGGAGSGVSQCDSHATVFRPRLFGRAFRRPLWRRLRAHRRHRAGRRARRALSAHLAGHLKALIFDGLQPRRNCAARSARRSSFWSRCRPTRTAIRCCACWRHAGARSAAARDRLSVDRRGLRRS